MENGGDSLRVGDYLRYHKYGKKAFLDRFRHPFLILVKVNMPEEETEDFITVTKNVFNMTDLMAVAEGRKFNPNSPVFPVAKREGANPYSGLITIGRASNCDIVVNIQGVSKFHAYLVKSPVEPGVFLVADGSSKNGTLVNESRIFDKERCTLSSGDHISLSSAATLRFFYAPDFWHILTS